MHPGNQGQAPRSMSIYEIYETVLARGLDQLLSESSRADPTSLPSSLSVAQLSTHSANGVPKERHMAYHERMDSYSGTPMKKFVQTDGVFGVI